MKRSTSYRKPVPVYVPSPPASPHFPASMQLPRALENDQAMPQFPADWRIILDQTSRTWRDTTISTASTSGDRSVRKPGKYLIPERSVPSLSVESPEGEKVPVEESNYTPLSAPINVSPSPERRLRRKLHQHYRPPTPPLPTHTRKRRITDSAPAFFHSCESPCPVFNDARGGAYPEPRRMPSMTAPSFSTTLTQSLSFKTEKTFLSSGLSEASTLWSRNTDAGPHDLPKPVGYTRASGRMLDTTNDSPRFSWWARIGTWGASLGIQLRRFTTTFIC